MTKRICIYPECGTVLSRYNDGDCCSGHEAYNQMARAGMRAGKVPEASPAMHARGHKVRGANGRRPKK